MEDENVEVLPSADNGNVPADAPAPSVEPKPDAPTETKETAEPAVPPVELFELPDGRKVDAVTLTKEWKENFLPDYTRKSQDLARVKETISPPLPTQPTNPLADPNYVPQSYEELASQIEARTLEKIALQEQERINAHKAIEDTVINQLTEVKKADPNVNENALFLHATKYKFTDLTLAHQNMKDMADLAKNVQKTTATNIAKRNDPVSMSPGATGANVNPSHFANAIEFFRSLPK